MAESIRKMAVLRQRKRGGQGTKELTDTGDANTEKTKKNEQKG